MRLAFGFVQNYRDPQKEETDEGWKTGIYVAQSAITIRTYDRPGTAVSPLNASLSIFPCRTRVSYTSYSRKRVMLLLLLLGTKQKKISCARLLRVVEFKCLLSTAAGYPRVELTIAYTCRATDQRVQQSGPIYTYTPTLSLARLHICI